MTDMEYDFVKKRLRVLTGLDLEAYKGAQMRRRLEGYLSRAQATCWTELIQRLEHDPQALQRVRDFLTINVSSFFRDRHKWDELRSYILPEIAQARSTVQVWSAGCSHGSEPYTLAMLLEENPGHGRYRVLGTDIDDPSLQQARAGGPFPTEEMREIAPATLQHYFRKEGNSYWVQPGLRAGVKFEKLDLLKVPALPRFDLVVCRNVMIYFTEEAKEKVVYNLVQSLRPGGFLFIGATENISAVNMIGLQRVGLSFYRRN